MTKRRETVLFSGRFDRPHIGHLITIGKLGQRFAKVIVPVLDYPEAHYPVSYRLEVLKDALSLCKGNYTVFANKHHFGKITKDELKEYTFNIYASGNRECLNHISDLGYETLYTPRSYDYAASKEFVKK